MKVLGKTVVELTITVAFPRMLGQSQTPIMDLPSQGTPGTFHVRASGTGSHTWRAFSVGQSSEAVEICGVFGRAGPRGDPKERNSVEEGCKLTCQPKSATFQMDFKNPYQSVNDLILLESGIN